LHSFEQVVGERRALRRALEEAVLTLYHFADAVCGQKVRTALAEKKLPWD
jgi:hypothetical protein